MKSRISCSVSSVECTEESRRATCRRARSWNTASSSAACRSRRMLRSSSTTLRPSASDMATGRISSATSGSAWMTTSVWPLASRATSTASSNPAAGPTRGSDIGRARPG